MGLVAWIARKFLPSQREDFFISRGWLKIHDPVFGKLRGRQVRYGDDEYFYWVGAHAFDLFGEDADVCIFSNQDGPTDGQRSLYVELRERYPELRQAIEKPLADEYEQIRLSWQIDSVPLENQSDIWKVARLSRIEINREAAARDLVFAHVIDWEDDHALNVVVTDWRVVEVLLEG